MTPWEMAIDALEPVGLDEINAEASLQRRVDRKYVVQPEVWAQTLASLEPSPRVLSMDGLRRFRYESVYYDTPELDLYRAAATRRPRRFKVRERRYVDTGSAAIEIKLRSRTGETVKHREWMEHTPGSQEGLSGPASEFVASFPQTADALAQLSPALTTAYTRVTLLAADARVTVDSAVTGTDVDGRSVHFGDALIVETKSVARAGSVDKALWAHGARPMRVSKYCTSLAALRPDLPSNRWARTLRRYLTTIPAPAGA